MEFRSWLRVEKYFRIRGLMGIVKEGRDGVAGRTFMLWLLKKSNTDILYFGTFDVLRLKMILA